MIQGSNCKEKLDASHLGVKGLRILDSTVNAGKILYTVPIDRIISKAGTPNANM